MINCKNDLFSYVQCLRNSSNTDLFVEKNCKIICYNRCRSLNTSITLKSTITCRLQCCS